MRLLQQTISLLTIILLVSCANNGNEGWIEESGTIETTEILISSLSSGIIEKVFVDEGAEVNAGDTLLIIDSELLEIQLKQAQALEQIAEAKFNLLIKGSRKEDVSLVNEQLKQAEANFKNAEKDFERMKNLKETQTITQKIFDDAETRYTVAKAQYDAAKENFEKIKNIARPEEIKQAQANLNNAKANISLIEKRIRDCFVTAPISGVVVNRFVEIGELVNPQSTLVKISNLTKVELVVYISEKDLGRIKLGQDVEIKTDTYEDKTYPGRVTFISPEAEFTPKNIQTKDERTKLVFAVKVEAENPGYELKTGMPADAKIIID
ncbi:MAG: efflux RND transporter periplasmic adaptor subunit [Melioribacteraceae bacterium]|nr:efflux RND transporter periplasmic adaptor subunit [Melioribacteraceae bacterium]MCF8356716.1 efflux RND transporter periplasmic adaptor subunit [Melioribacteraceae bacterium]MCF8396100.1 efflux RND transporter periplasmic adaptor subunit [Melioribacteraceae bacterium]MCF8421086.1 efflux RND transporter periplasmic adaptor subunit [Melioribacteraceae bacterium]